MRDYRWERHNYDHATSEHVKAEEGTFLAGSLRGARTKATRASLISGKAIWRLQSIQMAFEEKGRVYKRQVTSRPDYTNMNPIVYLFVGG